MSEVGSLSRGCSQEKMLEASCAAGECCGIPTAGRGFGLHVLPKYLFYVTPEPEFLEFPEC